jgi:glutathione S-transferase
MSSYTIYGFELSYFTRKMEAAFRLHGVPFEGRSKTVLNWRRLERGSGSRLVPVVKLPDGRLVADSTPIIERLDTLKPERRLFPGGPAGVLVRLVEEWLDEWFPRSVIHYRWQYPECSDFAGDALTREAAPWVPAFARRHLRRRIVGWGEGVCRHQGLDRELQKRAVEEEAQRVWAGLDEQLRRTPYAMGDRPTAVDAVLLGALRGHYLQDPIPRRIMDRFTRVLEWEPGADTWDGSGEIAPFPEGTDFARMILGEMSGAYRAFILANARALERGERNFEVRLHGEELSLRSRKYSEKSRRMLRSQLEQGLKSSDRTLVADWLAENSLDDVFPVCGGD